MGRIVGGEFQDEGVWLLISADQRNESDVEFSVLGFNSSIQSKTDMHLSALQHEDDRHGAIYGFCEEQFKEVPVVCCCVIDSFLFGSEEIGRDRQCKPRQKAVYGDVRVRVRSEERPFVKTKRRRVIEETRADDYLILNDGHYGPRNMQKHPRDSGPEEEMVAGPAFHDETRLIPVNHEPVAPKTRIRGQLKFKVRTE